MAGRIRQSSMSMLVRIPYLYVSDSHPLVYPSIFLPFQPPWRRATARSAQFGGVALARAVAAQQVRQRVVALVAGVFVDAFGRPRHGQFTFPRLRERRRVVDLEPIEQRIGVEKTEALHDVKVPVPPEVPARVAVETAAIVEVR